MKSGLKFSQPVWVHSVVFYGTSLALEHPGVSERGEEGVGRGGGRIYVH